MFYPLIPLYPQFHELFVGKFWVFLDLHPLPLPCGRHKWIVHLMIDGRRKRALLTRITPPPRRRSLMYPRNCVLRRRRTERNLGLGLVNKWFL